MTTAIIRRARAHTPRPIVVGDGQQVVWSEVFDGNPHLAREVTRDCVWVKAHPGKRPYIRYVEPGRMVWNESFRAEPGELYLTDEERDWPDRDFVYIEPNVKGDVYKNKDWGFANWQKVVDALPGIKFVQGSGAVLARVLQRPTVSFRHACGLLSHARLFVGTDGGLHHAAAALGIGGVVVWGGLINPRITGYETHTNLCRAKGFCGMTGRCDHCQAAMRAVTVEDVVRAIEECKP